MKINEVIDHDHEHREVLGDTGYWGKQGAGCIVFSRNSGRFLFPKRSIEVQEPLTWGVFGGAIDPTEDPKKAAARELEEEAGKTISDTDLIPLYKFEDDTVGFRYFNYIALVDDEFDPVLNWENDDYVWVEFGDWPSPLHFGVNKLLQDPRALNTLKDLTSVTE